MSWNPVVPAEFITASDDGSVRACRVSSDDGTVAVKMLWGAKFMRLCATDVVLEGATGLSPTQCKLLAQRGDFNRGLYSVEYGSDDGSGDGDGFDNGSEDEE